MPLIHDGKFCSSTLDKNSTFVIPTLSPTTHWTFIVWYTADILINVARICPQHIKYILSQFYGMWLWRGLGFEDRAYWTLWSRAWLHFTIHYYTHTHSCVHSHVFTSRCSVAAFNNGRSHFSMFPDYPRPQLLASHSNSSQRLNLSISLTNSVTHQPTQISWLTNCPAYNISERTEQKTPFLYCCLRAVV
jgi:hypothetical protein